MPSSRMDDQHNKSMTTIIMISSNSSVIINNSEDLCQTTLSCGNRKASTLEEEDEDTSSSSASSDFDDVTVNTGDVTASPKSSTSSTLSSGIESGISVSGSKPLVNFFVERSGRVSLTTTDCHKTRSLDRSKETRQQQQQPSSFCTVSRRRRRSRFASILEEEGQNDEEGVSLKPIGSVLPTGWHRHPHVFKDSGGQYSTVGRNRNGFKGSSFEPSMAKSSSCLIQRRHTTYMSNGAVKPQQLRQLPTSSGSSNKHIHSWHKTFDAVRRQASAIIGRPEMTSSML